MSCLVGTKLSSSLSLSLWYCGAYGEIKMPYQWLDTIEESSASLLSLDRDWDDSTRVWNRGSTLYLDEDPLKPIGIGIPNISLTDILIDSADILKYWPIRAIFSNTSFKLVRTNISYRYWPFFKTIILSFSVRRLLEVAFSVRRVLEVVVFKRILRCFELVLRLKINSTKSMLLWGWGVVKKSCNF